LKIKLGLGVACHDIVANDTCPHRRHVACSAIVGCAVLQFGPSGPHAVVLLLGLGAIPTMGMVVDGIKGSNSAALFSMKRMN